jgi:hypothetical protein
MRKGNGGIGWKPFLGGGAGLYGVHDEFWDLCRQAKLSGSQIGMQESEAIIDTPEITKYDFFFFSISQPI